MRALILDAQKEPKHGYKFDEYERRTGVARRGNNVWRHPKLIYKNVEKPKILSPSQVLLKIKACGVCGTDFHFIESDKKGYILFPGYTKFPIVVGHEFSGEVIEVGKNVEHLALGDKVSAEMMVYCGYCDSCRSGFPNQCANLRGIGTNLNGAFAEYLTLESKLCHKIDSLRHVYKEEGRLFEAGALVEPVAVAYSAIFAIGKGFNPGSYVVIHGAGPIGLAAIALSKIGGASKIIVFEPCDSRRKIARLMGADFDFDPYDTSEGISAGDKVLEITNGKGADLQIETAGELQDTWAHITKSLAVNSKIIQIGRSTKKTLIDLEALQIKRSKIYGQQGHCGKNIFSNVIRLMSNGNCDFTNMITKRCDLKELPIVLQNLEQVKNEGKVMVKI